jgi:hypothetical protein
MNFGQRPFAHTAPSGFKALCTQNLPTPTIGATSTTQAGKYFNAVLYTGNDTNRTIDCGLQTDFIWTKGRNAAVGNRVSDSVRGASGGLMYNLVTNLTSAENTDTVVTGIVSNGFTLTGGNHPNNTGTTYVAWGWQAGGTGVTNTVGSITSTVSANTTAGFSVVTWTGNGGSSENVGTGLSTTSPLAMAIVKRRSGTSDWWVGHQGILGQNFAYRVLLNSTAASSGSGPYVLGSQSSTNGNRLYLSTEGAANTVTYVAYCFQQIAGYSAFGSYTGNGSTDGALIYTGFRPKFVLVKAFNNAENWAISDTARSPYNAANAFLRPDESSAETTGAMLMDFLSNGFKLRTTDTKSNGSGYSYIYAAFAESPFKYSLAR